MSDCVPLWVPFASALGSGTASALVARLLFTRKERADLRQKNYENTLRVAEMHDNAYQSYIAALRRYFGLDTPTVEDFFQLASSGDPYFRHAGVMADTVLSGLVNEDVRDNSWLPKLRVVIERTLPRHYETLALEAQKRGVPYTGKLRRQDHESLYALAEKYAGTSAWERAARDE